MSGYNRKKLTKDSILNTISEIDIFEYYLGVKVEFGIRFTSPLRKDKNAGCKFWHNGTKLKYQDYARGISEDCFGIVSVIYNIKFKEVLVKIAEDFNILGYGNKCKGVIIKREVTDEEQEESNNLSIITVKSRKLNIVDKNFWTPFCITSSTLKHFDIVPVFNYSINGVIKYLYHNNNPAYCYNFIDGSKKIYMPYNKVKFIGNSHYIQGLNKIPREGDLLIITKSMKDVMVLYELGYTSIAPQSESSKFEDGIIESLQDSYTDIILFYDNDETGIKFSNKLKELYEISSIQIPLKSKVKDISDYIKKFGKLKTLKLLENLIENEL